MNKKDGLLHLLSLAFQEESQFAASLTHAEKAEVGAFERWSARDTLAHNAFWKQHRAEQIADPFNRELTGFRDFDQLNAQIYSMNQHLSWDDVLENARVAYEYLSERVRSLNEEDLTYPERYPWLNGRPLWRMVVNSGYNHPLNHITGYLYRRGQEQRATALQDSMALRMQELDEDPEWRGITLYNLACFYATTGRPQPAIRNLVLALELSPGLIEWARQDSDLATLQGVPEYEGIYAQR